MRTEFDNQLLFWMLITTVVDARHGAEGGGLSSSCRLSRIYERRKTEGGGPSSNCRVYRLEESYTTESGGLSPNCREFVVTKCARRKMRKDPKKRGDHTTMVVKGGAWAHRGMGQEGRHLLRRDCKQPLPVERQSSYDEGKGREPQEQKLVLRARCGRRASHGPF